MQPRRHDCHRRQGRGTDDSRHRAVQPAVCHAGDCRRRPIRGTERRTSRRESGADVLVEDRPGKGNAFRTAIPAHTGRHYRLHRRRTDPTPFPMCLVLSNPYAETRRTSYPRRGCLAARANCTADSTIPPARRQFVHHRLHQLALQGAPERQSERVSGHPDERAPRSPLARRSHDNRAGDDHQALRSGYRIVERPSHESARLYGKSHVNVWRAAPRYAWSLLSHLIR